MEIQGVAHQLDILGRLKHRFNVPLRIRVLFQTTLQAAPRVFFEQTAMTEVRSFVPDFILGFRVAEEREEVGKTLLPPALGIIAQQPIAAKALTENLRD